jgi:prefoldin subunit 5
VLAIGFLGCASIQMIGQYDQKIDDGITNLQKATADFFTTIERQGGSKPEDYKTHAKFYDNTKVALSGLIVRANAVSLNKLTAKELDNLSKQYQALEMQDQKFGIKQAEIPQLESAYNRAFTALFTLEVAKKVPSSQGASK